MFRVFNYDQRRLIMVVALLETLRTFGIFMANPVVAIYAHRIGASDFLSGVALGAYGLTMAIFQYPMGRLSDSIGRRRGIFVAAVPFIVGNLICFYPFNIYGLIAGRFIAGSGAINSVSIAMVQEHISDDQRSRAMAILGIPVGLAFLVGTAVGPVFLQFIGGNYIFLIIAILTFVGILPVIGIKDNPVQTARKAVRKISVKQIELSVVGFLASMFVMMFFYYVPLEIASLGSSFWLYFSLPVIIGGFVAVLLSSFADRGHTVQLAVLSVIFLAFSAPFIFSRLFPIEAGLFAGISMFVLGFSIYEIVFTPMVSRLSSRESYGSGVGLLRSLQYFGQFSGSVLAGVLYTIGSSDPSGKFFPAGLIIVLLSIPILYAATGFNEKTIKMGKT
ncbi:MAG: MFS transporter [Thermoplasmataceae archaeon]